jgi:hypothetical protein
MTDYFDYILESSSEDIDDVDVIYNEYEMTINEFDSYVQEGVGAKILLGIGFAALIGLFISAIIKLVSNKSEQSAAVAVSRAKYLSKLAKQYGVEQVVFDAEHKKGWMTDLNMRAFEIILQESLCAADTMREQIEYLEGFDEKDIKNIDIKEKLFEMWNKNEAKVKRGISGHLKALKGKTLDDFDIFAKSGKYVPERMSGKDPYGGWGETGTKEISLIDDRLNSLSQFIKEFKSIGKDLQNLQKRAASLEKSKPTLMSRAEGNMDKEMVSMVIEYVNEANRIMTESADAIRDAIKIQISENKKKTDKSSDDNTEKNRVDVKDLMNGNVDFDDFMSNPNSQMAFGKRDGD